MTDEGEFLRLIERRQKFILKPIDLVIDNDGITAQQEDANG